MIIVEDQYRIRPDRGRQRIRDVVSRGQSQLPTTSIILRSSSSRLDDPVIMLAVTADETTRP